MDSLERLEAGGEGEEEARSCNRVQMALTWRDAGVEMALISVKHALQCCQISVYMARTMAECASKWRYTPIKTSPDPNICSSWWRSQGWEA